MNTLGPLVGYHYNAINTRIEVLDSIDAVVKKIEAQSRIETHKEHEGKLLVAARLTQHFAQRVKTLENENEELVNQMVTLKNGAQAVREKFAVDIGRMLSESKDMVNSKAAMKDLRRQIRDQKKINKMIRSKEHDMKAEIDKLQMKIKTMEEDVMKKREVIEELEKSIMSIPIAKGALVEESKGKNDSTLAVKSAVDEVDSFFSELSSASLPTPELSATESPKSNQGSPKQSSPSTREKASTASTKQPESPCILSDLEDTELLEILTFLDTAEVLAAAQANRFVFTRVDEMFSLESKIAKPYWKVKKGDEEDVEKEDDAKEGSLEGKEGDSHDLAEPLSEAQTGAQESAQQPNAVQNFFTSLTSSLTNQMSSAGALDGVDPELCILPQPVLDLLRTKLTSAEMRAITNLNQVAEMNVKKAEELVVEKEDMQQRLTNTETVRDFLITKLKSAEKALKSSIKEISGCRKQATADGEVIHFLDTRAMELDGKVKELEMKRQGLQTAYDLYRSTHSRHENRLSEEVLALKATQMQSELSHKAEKKVLVKEIKSLRVALDQASGERDIYAAQLRSINQALSAHAGSGKERRTSGQGPSKRRGSHEA